MTPTKCTHCDKTIPVRGLIVLDQAAGKVWCSTSCWQCYLEAVRDAGSKAES